MRRAGIAGGDRWRRGRAGFKIRYPTIALVSLLKTSSNPETVANCAGWA